MLTESCGGERDRLDFDNHVDHTTTAHNERAIDGIRVTNCLQTMVMVSVN